MSPLEKPGALQLTTGAYASLTVGSQKRRHNVLTNKEGRTNVMPPDEGLV
jgi:hypothetical protein